MISSVLTMFTPGVFIKSALPESPEMYIVKEGNYYANSKKFVLPSSLFMLELRARCHSQLKMVPKKLWQIF